MRLLTLRLQSIGILAAITFSVAFSPLASVAADPAFVGVLALAVQDDVAERLGLSDETKAKLVELINEREKQAEQIVLGIKDRPDQLKKVLQAFAADSQKRGLKLLSAEQQRKLMQIRIARDGMITLGEPAIALQLKLSGEQNEQVKKLLDQRLVDLTKGGQQQRQIVNAEYEKKLLAVLNETQQLAWRAMAGLENAVVAADEPKAADKKPAEPKPAVAKKVKPDKKNPKPAPKVAVALVGDGKLRFSFDYAAWDDVLKWFAEQAELSLQKIETPPPGTFNYSDNRSHTIAESLDLINGALQFRGHMLVRNRQMLILVNLEDGIPPGVVETVTPDALDERGKFELLRCLFPLGSLTPEDVENEIRPLIPDPNAMKVMPTLRQVLIQETGGNLRMIRSVMKSADAAAGARTANVNMHPLNHVTADEVMAIARPLLGIGEGEFVTGDGSLKIAFEPLGIRVFYSGTAEAVAQFKQILELTDVAPAKDGGPAPEQPQLIIHSVKADPATVLQVLQIIFAGQDGIRLTTDPATGNLVALARPSQHKTIKAIIDDMARDAVQFDVIQLTQIDPQSMVLLLNKLYGKDNKENANKGPAFDGNPTTMQLVVRGTLAEIEHVKAIVAKMDPPLAPENEADRLKSRLIPLTGQQLSDVLGTAELLWPAGGRSNRIRVVMRRGSRPTLNERGIVPPPREEDLQRKPPRIGPPAEPAEPTKRDATKAPEKTSTSDRSARFDRNRIPIRFVAFPQLAQNSQNTENEKRDEPKSREPDKAEDKKEPPKAPKAKGDLPEIIVTVRPQGIVIASDDVDALDEFEKLIRSLMSGDVVQSQPSVFYLKNAKADQAAALLEQTLGLSGGGGAGGGGLTSMIGGMASNMVGGPAGDLLGGLLGGGGEDGDSASLQTSGEVTITPDVRLNLLIVQANATDMDLIDQLVKVIDQDRAPQDPETAGKTYIIPIYFMAASDMANVVKQAFPENIIGSGSSAQGRQPSPQEFIRAIAGRGGQGRSRGGRDGAAEERKMALGIDDHSNSLVITGPEHLYKQVLSLVERLDRAGINSTESVSVISLNGSINSQTLKKSLDSILGEQVKTSTTSGSSTSQPSSQSTTGQPATQQQGIDQFRQRMEMFRALQQRQGGDSRSGGVPGGGRTGRSGGGIPGAGIPGGGSRGQGRGSRGR